MQGMKPLTIWTDFKLPAAVLSRLQQGVGEHRLIFAQGLSDSILVGGGPDSTLAQADIAFGQPDPQQVIELNNLRWVELTTAGYTRYDRHDLKSALKSRSAILTNSSSVFDDPCAQHALAMMLALARQLPQCVQNQMTKHEWKSVEEVRPRTYLLTGQTALLVGFGSIAKRFAELLAPFKMNLIGFRRSVRGDEPIRMANIDKLDEFLPTADHVINILPASKSTEHFFNADRFAKMKRSAVFYNIGRGTTVQGILRLVLETESIAAAYLDVTAQEPLPPHDPLWTTPNCYITPHIAGGHSNEYERLVEHFLKNLDQFQRNEPLIDRIV
jgi:phosphoglycerate dehydrogenase-like enzyme